MSDKDVTTSPILSYFESRNFNSEVSFGKKIIKSYSSVKDEVNALYRGVGLRDVSFKGIIELKGKDVLDYLHRITTNHLKDLPKEKLAHTIFTSEKGRIIDVGTILNFEDHQLLICSTEYKAMVKRWIDKYTITDDVKAFETDGKYVMLELYGPQANSFLMFMCGGIVNSIQPDSFRVVNSEDMLFFLAKIKEKNGTHKFLIIADSENGKKIVEYMSGNKGPFDFELVGEDAYNMYRIEQGLPSAPDELHDSVNPHEVKLLDMIDFKKGCYIGQEVIARLDTYEKVQKYLLGVKFEQEPQPGSVYNLTDDEGKEAGKVTSIVYSDSCKQYIGLAFIRKQFAEEGKHLLAADDKDNKISVVVNNLPFRK